jgi:uncharacterized membrane protein (DUF373 family)
MKWVSFIMSFVSISLCVFLLYIILFTNLLSDRLFGYKKTMMLLILVIYTIYRGFMTYQQWKKLKLNRD